MSEPAKQVRDGSIWLAAFGYFASYVPYTAMTKLLSSTELLGPKVPGNAILPVSALTSMVVMVVFVWASGWWRSATQWTLGSLTLPRPTQWTFLSGLCGATIITTTTLAYTFEGVSIVLMMLLMRGGVLVMAPMVDLLTGRAVRWFSWVALGLTLVSLFVGLYGNKSLSLSAAAVIDVGFYLLAYFVRLRFMTRLAKSDSASQGRRFFVEEQLVSSPMAALALVVLAIIGQGEAMNHIRQGLTQVPFSPSVWWVIAIGVCSQGTGVFGALVLLDKRENTFTVPVNRASSVLAGVVATVALSLVIEGSHLPPQELIGAGLVIAAILVLSLGGLLGRKPPAAAPVR